MKIVLTGNSHFDHVWLAIDDDLLNTEIFLTKALLVTSGSAILHHKLNPKIVRIT